MVRVVPSSFQVQSPVVPLVAAEAVRENGNIHATITTAKIKDNAFFIKIPPNETYYFRIISRVISFYNNKISPKGIDALSKAHPDVEIVCANVDEKLNEVGYIVPGLGDAGDRIFGTK